MGCTSSAELPTPIGKKDKQAAVLTVGPQPIDLQAFIEGDDDQSEKSKEICQQVLHSLHTYGLLIIRDPRVNFDDNKNYIDLMETYYEKIGKVYEAGGELEDARPQAHYLVGLTPEGVEMARPHPELIASYTEDNKPVSPLVPVPDVKVRFQWNIGERPSGSGDDFPKVIPKGFPQWEEKMDAWGYRMIAAVNTVAECSALGLGLKKETFTEKLQGGPHILSPTGSDLKRYDVGAIFAGFHYDIAFLTIHGKSRFPGLHAWMRDGTKIPVKVPDGCLLLQSGRQFEHLSGGYIMAGMHEVTYTDKTKEAMLRAKDEGRSTWRVSSTLFSMIRNDASCAPLPEMSHLYDPEAAKGEYGQKTGHDILMEELDAIGLAAK